MRILSGGRKKTMFFFSTVAVVVALIGSTQRYPFVEAFNLGSRCGGDSYSRRGRTTTNSGVVFNPLITVQQARRRTDVGQFKSVHQLAAESGGGGGGGGSDDDGIEIPATSSNRWEEENDSTDDGGSLKDSLKQWIASGEAQEDAKTYTISLVFALLLRFLVVEPRYIPSLSMYPTFEVGDQIAVEKVTKRIRPLTRKEIVVFNPPSMFTELMGDSVGREEAAKKSKEALIKRIVAVEGDEVKVREGRVYVNGEKQDEPYTAEDAAYEFGPVTVPPGQLLVLGDNRNHSFDGHLWGFLPKKNVIGRAVFTYWPPWRIGNEGMY